MKKQLSLSFVKDELASVKTGKKAFLEKIDHLVPWDQWVSLIQPYYYKGERGNKPFDLELMLRIYILQNLYNLSDMGAQQEIIDARSFSAFCRVESSNQIPNGDTIGRFRNLLIRHKLQEKIFALLEQTLRAEGLLLQKGTIVDSTLIAAPSSTKNREKKRDEEAHQVKKGNNWHFGYKAHVGVDQDSGLVHHVEVTAANVHDVSMTSRLLHGAEKEVHGDSGYLGAEKREDALTVNEAGEAIEYRINMRPSSIRKTSVGASEEEQANIRMKEKSKSSVRAKVEHVFAMIKGTFKYRKTRYRGLSKQTATLHMLFALANLVLMDRRRQRLVCCA